CWHTPTPAGSQTPPAGAACCGSDSPAGGRRSFSGLSASDSPPGGRDWVPALSTHSFLLGLIDLLVYGAGLQQLLMGAPGGDVVVVQDQDLVGVLHRGDALGDHDDGGVLQVFGEGGPDGRLGGGVHRGGGVV